MSHYIVLALTTTDDETQLDGLLAPYDESFEVDAHKEHLDLGWLRAELGDVSDAELLGALRARFLSPDEECGLDEAGVFVLTTANPRARWDWWALGGRWEGSLVLQGGHYADRALAGEVDWDATDALAGGSFCPHAVLSAEGWREPGRMGWFGQVQATPEQLAAHEQWFCRFRATLPAGVWLWVLDCHI